MAIHKACIDSTPFGAHRTTFYLGWFSVFG
jgi:hypothetical protein